MQNLCLSPTAAVRAIRLTLVFEGGELRMVFGSAGIGVSSGSRRGANTRKAVWLSAMAALLLLPAGLRAVTTHHTHTIHHRRAHHVVHRLVTRRRRVAHHYRHHLTASELARSRRLHTAFVASAELRPMAQQLVELRTPQAYAGVEAWARRHSGEAAATAYLALGHAHLLDQDYRDALTDLHLAALHDHDLRDYIAYLTAEAEICGGMYPQAAETLSTFDAKYPDSLLRPRIPVMRANVYLAENDASDALAVLHANAAVPIDSQAAYLLALAKAEQMAGNHESADADYERLFAEYPASDEADHARDYLNQHDLLQTLSPDDLYRNAEAIYRIGNYNQAKREFLLLADSASLSDAARNAYRVMAAACDEKMARLTQQELDGLHDYHDEAEAHSLYLQVEFARYKDDDAQVQRSIDQLEQDFPHSPWLADALFSAGNMYLLRPDYSQAAHYYLEISKRFPYMCNSLHHTECSNLSAKSHWRAAWLEYRLGHYDEAAKLFDEEIANYPGTEQFSTALYWRGRLYERNHEPALAAAYYDTEIRLYPQYYYAIMAQRSLAKLGPVTPSHVAFLDRMNPDLIPDLSDDVPQDDPHVVKAHLLANAALNEFVAPEIDAAAGSREWGAFAEAQIFSSDNEAWRAMRLMKRELPFYTSAPLGAIPMAYWDILYPQPYWTQIQKSSTANGLNPYMVASLIRQETEFRPNAVSGANAYGLMQLLPSVGRAMARQEGIRRFRTNELLNPYINIRLGTLYLKQMLDKFDGNPEYAFAAYNAGDNRVTSWQQLGPYQDMAEFVESIPFTQTREYVEAIVRNEYMYRKLNAANAEQADLHAPAHDTVRK